MPVPTFRGERSVIINVELIKKSFEELAPFVETLTDRFFERLFDEYPKWKLLFDRVELEDHRLRFARGLAVMVRLADDNNGLKWFSEQLGARHVNYGAGSADFAAAAAILQHTMAEVAGPKTWTHEYTAAWNELLKNIADWMQNGATEGSWESSDDWDDDPALVGTAAVVAGQQQQPNHQSEMVDRTPNAENWSPTNNILEELSDFSDSLSGQPVPELDRRNPLRPSPQPGADNIPPNRKERDMITATRPGNGQATLTDSQPQTAVEESNQNTEAVIRVTVALQDVETVDAAVAVTLGTVRDAFGWAYGSFWRVDKETNVLKFDSESGTVNEEFRRVTQDATFPEGVGLSGRAWKQRELLFVEDIGSVTDCCRAPVAQRAGIKSGLCFPIFVNGCPLGTIDFFATETLAISETRMSVLRNLGSILTAALDRLELREAAVRTQNMMDNVPINVVFADRNLDISYVNPASLKTLRQLEHLLPIPVDQILGSNVDVFHKDPEMQRRILSNPDNLPHRAKIKLGEETLDLSVCAIYDKDRNYIGPMATWEIITDRVKLAEDVMQGVAVVASSATELQANSKTMASTAEETSRQSQVVAAASEQATRNVETVSSATEELTASISEISRHVQDASKITGQAVLEAGTTNETIAELGEASQEIGKVVKVITSIAQQTNLLALNATIEAARAGEAGKGFAVVANEVKELARQTANATEEISQKIGAIQSSTGVAVSAIGSIGETIGKINEIATTIAGAVEEQTAATNEIARNVGEAAKGTAEVSSNIGGVAQAADESGKASADILTAADGLAQEAVRLEQVVKSFVE